MPGEFLAAGDKCGAGLTQVLGQPWEQRFRNHLAAQQQGVCMAALGHAFARLWVERARVALHQRDRLEVGGEDARREQTGNAAAEHDGMSQWAIGHGLPSSHPCEVSRITGVLQSSTAYTGLRMP